VGASPSRVRNGYDGVEEKGGVVASELTLRTLHMPCCTESLP
jgi:hypothetical protein